MLRQAGLPALPSRSWGSSKPCGVEEERAAIAASPRSPLTERARGGGRGRCRERGSAGVPGWVEHWPGRPPPEKVESPTGRAVGASCNV